MGINYHDIAMTYIELNQFELARDYLLKSLGMFKKIGDERYELDAYLNLASCAAETGDTKEKTFYYNMALNLSKKLGVNSAIYKSSIEVAKIHQADGEYQKANELLFEALNYNDSLNITKSSKELSALQFKFEAEKKLRQLEQAKNVISKNNLAMKQQKWRFIFVSGFIGLLVIVISIAYIIKRRYAKNVIGKNVELMRIQKDLAQHTQELEVARKFAEQASEAKAMFLANMSHEIRTPLNTILGSAELLKSSCSDTGNLRHLEAIIISGRGLLKTINAILELSKYESGKEPIALAPIDIIDLCNELEIQFTPLFQKKNISFSIQFNSPKSLSLIISDEVKIRQILLNLIGNALKFTVEGSVIVKSQVIIFTSQNGFKEEYLVISVEDTGKGISEDKHRSIFESFVQVEQSSLEKTEGTGLGLAIAKRCANLLNGDISLNSIIGKGSTFTVKIPVTISGQLPVDNDDVQITLSKIQSLNEAKPITVIVVDDVLDNRKLIAHFLVETGMRVLEAESARETLRILDSVTPDLILLDLRMPQISGFELNKMLKANPNWAKIPVIAVSASMAEEDKSMVTNANFDMKLQKPFTHKELIDSVYNILIRTT
ncbi:MAG: ATP-binding protein [Sphingobacteriia bacterium]|nr:ATP-binding protein [Sphingobacteriia bacterium]